MSFADTSITPDVIPAPASLNRGEKAGVYPINDLISVTILIALSAGKPGPSSFWRSEIVQDLYQEDSERVQRLTRRNDNK